MDIKLVNLVVKVEDILNVKIVVTPRRLKWCVKTPMLVFEKVCDYRRLRSGALNLTFTIQVEYILSQHTQEKNNTSNSSSFWDILLTVNKMKQINKIDNCSTVACQSDVLIHCLHLLLVVLVELFGYINEWCGSFYQFN